MFIMFVIVLSSIALASEDPVNEESPRNVFLGKADYAFTAIFTMECTLKVRLFYIIVLGLGGWVESNISQVGSGFLSLRASWVRVGS